jgi:mannonate dehydratase
VIRLPEDQNFDITSDAHWEAVHKRFTDFGVTPGIIEPMPNELHDHIKAGDENRDECIEKAIGMLPKMERLGIKAICFNWMAHIGWLRTTSEYPERGGAKVTAFCMEDFTPTGAKITHEQLWDNYKYFLDAILPHAEKHGVQFLLHPDDPPVPYLGNVGRIMINNANIHKAIFAIHPSDSLGLTLCQANFHIMGEDLFEIAREYKEKIGFIHFRNTTLIPGGFRVNYGLAMLYGILGSAAGTFGDLCFSVIKRQTGIKDYGNLIPGHGGVLDRFDSMIIVAPVTEAMLILIPLAVK